MVLHKKYITDREDFTRYIIQFVLAELRDNWPLLRKDVLGILKNEFGVYSRKHKSIKEEALSEFEKMCFIVEGCDGCLETDDNVTAYYPNRGLYEILTAELF